MATDARPPSGAQHEIRHGDQVAVVTEVGATLRGYRIGERAVVQDFAVDALPDGGRGQVLAPWPNRVEDGQYSWDGSDLQLPLSEAGKRNAIHGLVRWAGWRVAARDESAVTMATTVWPSPGYPFLLELTAAYLLDDVGLTVTLSARNDGTAAAPYGVGHHPYLLAGPSVDDVRLTVPAATRLLVDGRGNPAGREPVEGTKYDFRSGRAVGDLVLDTAYADLTHDADGWVRVLIEGPDGSAVELRGDRATTWLQVFSGDTLAPHRRRTALAVEPMTCPPGAFRTGEDLVRLQPGAEHALVWGLRAW